MRAGLRYALTAIALLAMPSGAIAAPISGNSATFSGDVGVDITSTPGGGTSQSQDFAVPFVDFEVPAGEEISSITFSASNYSKTPSNAKDFFSYRPRLLLPNDTFIRASSINLETEPSSTLIFANELPLPAGIYEWRGLLEVGSGAIVPGNSFSADVQLTVNLAPEGTTAAVPVPATFGLLGVGLIGLGFVGRRVLTQRH
ncbi:PEP-CTERM sorting domain-containing protein [Rhodovibrio sodomensis]|uniref:PEP-CTERM sorting domain-containing protein n=1 Tax=Rhodovibrio sodomensis TaxID=1088 RepID=UPI0019046992|nr:PEP-CTERM sorting domain-containing protein [Rhodovibrio sodomensis]